MTTTVETRPDWQSDEYEHVVVTREEVWAELDQEARRLYGLTADEFLGKFRNPPEQYHGDPLFNSLCFLADLVAEPTEA